MFEEWRPIPTHPCYEASNLGRVRAVKRTRLGKIFLRKEPKILKPDWTETGYAFVKPSFNNRARNQFVSRLVLMAFVGLPTKAEMQADHINRNPKDNRLVNLRWVTPAENVSNRTNHSGESHYASKVTIVKVRRIRQLRASGMNPKAISEHLNISRSIVTHICDGSTWKKAI